MFNCRTRIQASIFVGLLLAAFTATHAQPNSKTVMKDGRLEEPFSMGGDSFPGQQRDWFQVIEGEYLKMEFPRGQRWAGVWITVGEPEENPKKRESLDLSKYSTLVIEMKGQSSDDKVDIGIKGALQPDNKPVPRRGINVGTEWRIYSIRIRDFIGEKSPLKDLVQVYIIPEFLNVGPKPQTIFVRSIKITSDQ